MKQKVVKFGTWIIFYSGVLAVFRTFAQKFALKTRTRGKVVFPFVQKKKARNLQILAYHRVNDDKDPFFPAVTTGQFARQMEYLSGYWSPLGLHEAIERLRENELPEKAVAVTFDDGYRDNYVNAYPILLQYGIPATIFLASGAIGSGTILWHDRVFCAFRNTKVFAVEIPGTEKTVSLYSLEEKLSAQAEVLRLLWHLTDEERGERVDQLEERLAVNGERTSRNVMLGWNDVLRMASGGVTFGSHTISHPILSRLSEDKLREEIGGSKKAIESTINRPVNAFAYPVGRKQDFNELVKHIVKEAGYLCAVTTVFGVNTPAQDLFELRRGTPWETDLPSYATKLCWYEFVANS